MREYSELDPALATRGIAMSMVRTIVDMVLIRRKPSAEAPAVQPSLLFRRGARNKCSAPPNPSNARAKARTPSADERSTPALLRANARRRY